MTDRSYSELSQLETFGERFKYLALGGRVGRTTFDHERGLNQKFYQSREWKRARRQVILRDESRDLGIPGYEIYRNLHVHHMIPITAQDLTRWNPDIVNPEYLISVSLATHNAIHYGDPEHGITEFTERRPGDHIGW